MNDFTAVAKRYCIYIVILIIVFLVIALVFTNQRFFLGLALGAVFSLFNLLSTYQQVKAVGTIMEGGTVRWAFGTLSRIISILLAIFIAMRFPEYFEFLGVIIGVMITYVLLLIEPFIFMKVTNSNTK